MIRLSLVLLAITATATAIFAQPKLKAPPKKKDAAAKKKPAQSALSKRVQDLIQDVREAELELKVKLRRTKLVRTKRDIVRVSVADPSIVQFLAFGPREVQFTGIGLGSTSVTLWLQGDQADGSDNKTLSMLLTTIPDRTAEERRRVSYAELQGMINEFFPNSRIQLIPIADKVIVRGQARDEREANKIMSILRAQGDIQAGSFTGFGFTSQGRIADPYPDGADLPDATLISMLEVPGVKQVMLKVRIAELSRSAARNLGVDFNLNLEDFLLSSALAGGGNIMATATFGENVLNASISALETNGVAKILAEPNLVVLSGQTANFIAGGQFPVPTVVGVGGAQAATTSFQGFGTQLTFTPTVLDRDRIRLQVAPTFSTLNSSSSVGGVFGLDVRSVATQVELREGQTFAIAGLLQEQSAGSSARIPFFGNLPLVRSLFESKSISRSEKELIILITPELVHPLEHEDAPLVLPGMDVTEPGDLEFFIRGRIEGRPGVDHRSTRWWTYRDRMWRKARNYSLYHKSDDYYICGPQGFSQ